MSQNKTKSIKKKRNLVTYREIAVRVIALALTAWIAMSGFVTWSVAADMYRQIELQISEYWLSAGSREVHDGYSKDIPGREEYGMLWNINFARDLIRLEPVFPFMLPYSNSLLSG